MSRSALVVIVASVVVALFPLYVLMLLRVKRRFEFEMELEYIRLRNRGIQRRKASAPTGR